MLSRFPNLLRVRNISSEVPESERPLKRVLGPVDLTMLGIGAIVGAGIFATVGTAAVGDETRPGAGPASRFFRPHGDRLRLCGAVLRRTRLARPRRRSAYSYAYATLGELVAWIIGWDLVLEYAVGNVAVAVSWSGYFQSLINPFLHAFHDRYPAWVVNEFPKWLGSDIRSALDPATKILESSPRVFGVPIIFNFPAVFIVTAITAVLVIGVKESAWFNTVMVAIKLVVLAFFCIVGAFYIRPENLHPFAPNGWQGIQAGAAVVFFAFIGFDAVSTAAEECRNPRRDLPIGILGSLGICTLIYVWWPSCLRACAITRTSKSNVNEPLSVAMTKVNLVWAAVIVAFGSVVAHTAVLLVFQLGQPRISVCHVARPVAAQSDGEDASALPYPARGHDAHWRVRRRGIGPGEPRRDGRSLQHRHALGFHHCVRGRYRPSLARFQRQPVPEADYRVRPAVIGVSRLRCKLRRTRRATDCVQRSVLALVWWRTPATSRSFRTPCVPVAPLLGIASCFWLSFGLPTIAWVRFMVWLIVGLIFCLSYGYWTRRTVDSNST